MATILIDKNLMAPMRDGVRLATDVYRLEGEFNPHFQEASDGVDTIAWAAAQPWSRGVVGTFGGSYLGCTQWLPAREGPPALQAMAPAITGRRSITSSTMRRIRLA